MKMVGNWMILKSREVNWFETLNKLYTDIMEKQHNYLIANRTDAIEYWLLK